MLRSLRDFHSLQLEAVNDLLAFTGFPKIRSIDEFSMVRFKEDLVRLDESGALQSTKKKLVAAYLKICRKRELPDSPGPPKNFDPEASVSTILSPMNWWVFIPLQPSITWHAICALEKSFHHSVN